MKVDENCYEVQVLIDCVQKEITVKEIVVDQNKECFLKIIHRNILYVIFFTSIPFLSPSVISSVRCITCLAFIRCIKNMDDK